MSEQDKNKQGQINIELDEKQLKGFIPIWQSLIILYQNLL